jgi:hypothetical protein
MICYAALCKTDFASFISCWEFRETAEVADGLTVVVPDLKVYVLQTLSLW